MARKGKKNDFIDDSDASLGEEEEASEEAAFSAEDGNDSEDVKPKSKKSSSKAAPKAKTVKDKKVKEKDVKPASKKRKASDDDDREQGSSKAGPSSLSKNEDGDYYADLDKYKRVTVRQFQGKTLIDIREFYTDRNTEEKKPGKKGIALNMEVWKALKNVMDAVDEEANRLESKN